MAIHSMLHLENIEVSDSEPVAIGSEPYFRTAGYSHLNVRSRCAAPEALVKQQVNSCVNKCGWG